MCKVLIDQLNLQASTREQLATSCCHFLCIDSSTESSHEYFQNCRTWIFLQFVHSSNYGKLSKFFIAVFSITVLKLFLLSTC